MWTAIPAIFEPVITSMITVLAGSIAAYFAQPLVLFIFIANIIAVTCLTIYIHRPVQLLHSKANNAQQQFVSSGETMLLIAPVALAHGALNSVAHQIHGRAKRLYAFMLRLDQGQARLNISTWIALTGLNAAFLAVLVWSSVLGFLPVTLGQIVLLATFFTLLTGASLALLSAVPTLARAHECRKGIIEYLGREEITCRQDLPLAKSFEQSIELRRVDFEYPGTKKSVVKDISLVIPFGSSMAIVGPSGAGKTTLLSVVCGLLSPSSGMIFIDGVDSRSFKAGSFSKHVGFVGQSTALLGGSVYENLTLGLNEHTEDCVVEALEKAEAWEFVKALPKGIWTPLGLNGYSLSGGQRQRIALARALIRRPRLLVLDEPTSALDPRTEVRLQETLRRVMQTTTTVIAAHRLSTIKTVDTIVVMDGGALVERGAFSDLIAKNSRFKELYQASMVLM
jgi:ATP-binding cassette, subfamily B, bacterial